MLNRLKFNIALLALLILVSTGFSSCSDDIDIPDMPSSELGVEEGYITMQIHCGEISTRATEAGIDELNENLISSVTVCLWPNSGDWPTSIEPLYKDTFTGINTQGTATIRIPLTDKMINTLFNQDESHVCNVFVAVNVDGRSVQTVDELRALAISSDFDSPDEKVQTVFAMDGGGTVEMKKTGNGYGASGTINVRRAASKIDLHLSVDDEVKEYVEGKQLIWKPDLKGMKVMLKNGVKNSQLDPVTDNIQEGDYFNTPTEQDYTFKRVSAADGDPAHSDIYPYVQEYPFYTYPNEWTAELNEPHRTFMILSVPWTSDNGLTYKTCYYQVPVTALSNYELVRNVSYHVRLRVSVLGSFVIEEPLELEELSYTAAEWGTENIDVDINDYRYLVVNENKYSFSNSNELIIPFYTSHPTKVIFSKMTFYRYNYSDQGTEFAVTVTEAMNNKTKEKTGKKVYDIIVDDESNDKTITIKHDLICYQPYDVNNKPVDLTNGDTFTTTRTNKTQTQTQVNNTLAKINYFQPVTPEDDEYSRVEYEFTIQHTDMEGKPNFKETLTVTQFPGMYITSISNYVAPGATSFDYSGAQGSTIINGNYSDINNISYTTISGDKTNGWMTSIGLSTGYLNWNPNMYLITITNLPNDKNYAYTIGDPRTLEINNYLSNVSMGYKYETTWTGGANTTAGTTLALQGFTDAPAIYPSTAQRKLKYYYPTDESSMNANTLAPKFRICSSYAGTADILSRELARRRAAAYQELGYAAGRWRLPTFAEVKFVMSLSAALKIPRLFGTQNNMWYYWSAQGAVKVPAKKEGNVAPTLDTSLGNTSPQRARFVYDEWFWGSGTLPEKAATPKYTFTWGDMLKNSPQDPAVTDE